MNNINFSVSGSKLTLTGSVMPLSGSFRYDKCVFTFDSEWTGFTKDVVFSMGNSEEYTVRLSGNNCNIPEELLRESGLLKVGVTGINAAGTVISTNQAALRVRSGANESETVPLTLAQSMADEGGGVG